MLGGRVGVSSFAALCAKLLDCNGGVGDWGGGVGGGRGGGLSVCRFGSAVCDYRIKLQQSI